MGAIINCFRLCVAPKRHPGCHGTCPDYLKEKAEYDARKAIHDKKNRTAIELKKQREKAVHKAYKRWKVN